MSSVGEVFNNNTESAVSSPFGEQVYDIEQQITKINGDAILDLATPFNYCGTLYVEPYFIDFLNSALSNTGRGRSLQASPEIISKLQKRVETLKLCDELRKTSGELSEERQKDIDLLNGVWSYTPSGVDLEIDEVIDPDGKLKCNSDDLKFKQKYVYALWLMRELDNLTKFFEKFSDETPNTLKDLYRMSEKLGDKMERDCNTTEPLFTTAAQVEEDKSGFGKTMNVTFTEGDNTYSFGVKYYCCKDGDGDESGEFYIHRIEMVSKKDDKKIKEDGKFQFEQLERFKIPPEIIRILELLYSSNNIKKLEDKEYFYELDENISEEITKMARDNDIVIDQVKKAFQDLKNIRFVKDGNGKYSVKMRRETGGGVFDDYYLMSGCYDDCIYCDYFATQCIDTNDWIMEELVEPSVYISDFEKPYLVDPYVHYEDVTFVDEQDLNVPYKYFPNKKRGMKAREVKIPDDEYYVLPTEFIYE